jgi:hypothetical protein
MKVTTGKPSPKLTKSKLDTLTYLISLHGLGAHAVPLHCVDFSLAYVDNQSPDVRNAAIELLVVSALNGAEDKVRTSIEKLPSGHKDVIRKKIDNAKAAKEGSAGKEVKKGGKGAKK